MLQQSQQASFTPQTTRSSDYVYEKEFLDRPRWSPIDAAYSQEMYLLSSETLGNFGMVRLPFLGSHSWAIGHEEQFKGYRAVRGHFGT